ncbi:hypothetical protein BTVI_09012 [Pitangus sulphuratus]|nr:hypothetical protein BTVI_09012 [Pitangus sulphuratus]
MELPSHCLGNLKSPGSQRKSQVIGKRGNIVPIFKKGGKEDSGNQCPISLTSMPGKTLEKIPPEALLRHMEEWELIWDSQYGFTGGKSCLTNAVALQME